MWYWWWSCCCFHNVRDSCERQSIQLNTSLFLSVTIDRILKKNKIEFFFFVLLIPFGAFTLYLNIPIFSLEIKWNASHSKICFPSHVNTRSYSKFHTTFFCGKIMKLNYSGLSTTAIIPQKKQQQQYRFSVHMWK